MPNHSVLPGDVYLDENGDKVKISWVNKEERFAHTADGDAIRTITIAQAVKNRDWKQNGYDYSVCSQETLYSEVYMMADALKSDIDNLLVALDRADSDDAVRQGSHWDDVVTDADEDRDRVQVTFGRFIAAYDALTGRV